MRASLKPIIFIVGSALVFFAYQNQTAVELPTSELTIDFIGLESNPLLKTKLGLALNMNEWNIRGGFDYITRNNNDLGLSRYCGGVEFQYWHRVANGEGNLDPRGISSVIDLTVDPADGRPLTQANDPRDYLIGGSSMVPTGIEDVLNENDIQPLFQIMGAPAQYQRLNIPKSAEMREPSDIPAAAQFMKNWLRGTKHKLPIMWSVWNEPGHTICGVEPQKAIDGKSCWTNLLNGVCPVETAQEFALRESQMRDRSSRVINEIYSAYEFESRSVRNATDQFGMASFIGGDFNITNLTTDNTIYFKKVMDLYLAKKGQVPGLSMDFISFNSFGGQWERSLEGARAVLANSMSGSKFNLTQYNPGIIERDAFNQLCFDGSISAADGCEPCDKNSSRYHPDICTNLKGNASAMQASIHRLNDISLFLKYPDLETACMSGFVGGPYGFLKAGNTYSEKPAYRMFKHYMSMPVLRRPVVVTKINGNSANDIKDVELDKYDYNYNRGVHVLASSNARLAGVLLWNDSNVPRVLSIQAKNLALALGLTSTNRYTYDINVHHLNEDPNDSTLSIDTLDNIDVNVSQSHYNHNIKINRNEVIMITYTRSALPGDIERNSLSRRKALGLAKFEKAISAASTVNTGIVSHLPSGDGNPPLKVFAPNGDYAYYDQVRSIAYLGIAPASNTEPLYSPRFGRLQIPRDSTREAKSKIYFKNFEDGLKINFKVFQKAGSVVNLDSQGDVSVKLVLLDSAGSAIAHKAYSRRGTIGTIKKVSLGSGATVSLSLPTEFTNLEMASWINGGRKVILELRIQGLSPAAQAEVLLSNNMQLQTDKLVSP